MKARLVILLFFLYTSPANGQNWDVFHLGIYGNLGFPVGEFRQTVQNSFGGTSVGAGINFFFKPTKSEYLSPVMIGMEFNYFHLGTDKTPESKFLPQLKTTYNYYNVGPLIRLFFNDNTEGFKPFLDGFIGLKILNTKTKIDNTLIDTINDEEYLEKLLSTNNEGLGFGLGLGFFKSKTKEEFDQGSLAFYMKLSYQYGDRITHVKKGSIEVDQDGFITYQTGHSQTSIVSIQFGIIGF